MANDLLKRSAALAQAHEALIDARIRYDERRYELGQLQASLADKRVKSRPSLVDMRRRQISGVLRQLNQARGAYIRTIRAVEVALGLPARVFPKRQRQEKQRAASQQHRQVAYRMGGAVRHCETHTPLVTPPKQLEAVPA